MSDREQRIREWAYRLWEQDGYPHGRDGEHWFRAVEIVVGEDAAPASAIAVAAPKGTRANAATTAPATEAAATPPKPARVKAAKAAAVETPVPVAPEPAPVAPVPAGRRKRS